MRLINVRAFALSPSPLPPRTFSESHQRFGRQGHGRACATPKPNPYKKPYSSFTHPPRLQHSHAMNHARHRSLHTRLICLILLQLACITAANAIPRPTSTEPPKSPLNRRAKGPNKVATMQWRNSQSVAEQREGRFRAKKSCVQPRHDSPPQNVTRLQRSCSACVRKMLHNCSGVAKCRTIAVELQNVAQLQWSCKMSHNCSGVATVSDFDIQAEGPSSAESTALNSGGCCCCCSSCSCCCCCCCCCFSSLCL
jgi:hypothetical protein